MAEAPARALKLGPDGYRKIAIIGSAPSSIRKAPYNSRDWAIWACSPGAFGVVPFGRSDVWWELHRYEPPTAGDPGNGNNQPWFSPEYAQFLQQHVGPVYLAGPDISNDNPIPTFRNGWRFPFEDYTARYGQYFFTSSMAWMLAHAIETLLGMRKDRAVAQEGEAIGLWGVDMAAQSEYAFQRPGCQHFIGLAISLGIQVILPPESDLMQPPTLYGISEYNPRHSKLLARLNEMEQQRIHWTNVIENGKMQLGHVTGAIDNLKYVFNTWIDEIDPFTKITSAVSMAGVAVSRPDAAAAALDTLGDPVDQSPATVAALETEIARLGKLYEDLRKTKKKPARRKK